VAAAPLCQWPQGCTSAAKPTGAARGPQWKKYCDKAEYGQPAHERYSKLQVIEKKNSVRASSYESWYVW
jgi:hypothetical protein